jgi:hypothetical protein
MENKDSNNIINNESIGSQTQQLSVKLVKAIYNFKASNNDELCFNKDDVIIHLLLIYHLIKV